MISRILSILLSAVLLVPSAGMGEQDDSLQSLAQPYGFLMGGPLSYSQMKDGQYLGLLEKHMNSVTMTNEMKAYSMLDQGRSKYRTDGMAEIIYTAADQMVGWAHEHGIRVRGHVLVWDAYMVDWFFHEGFDPSKPYADQETISRRVENYISRVIRHFEVKYPGTVYCWDVVNEAVGDNASEYAPGDACHVRTRRNGQDNLFLKYMGEDYVEKSFLYARNAVEELNADIRLYYNDYNAYFPEKAEAIIQLARRINTYAASEDGGYRKLLDGIGMQGYIGGYGTQQGCLEKSHLQMIEKAIRAYAAEGCEVQITEMAVRNFVPERMEEHASFYADLFEVFKRVNSPGTDKPLKAVSIWGLTDYPNEPKGTYVYNLNSPYGGLFDEQLQPKAAFYRVCSVLRGE